MPRTTTGNRRTTTTPRKAKPKKQVVGFIVSDPDDGAGMYVKTADEIGEAITKVLGKSRWYQPEDCHVRVVAEDGTIKCVDNWKVQTKAVTVEVTAPTGFKL